MHDFKVGDRVRAKVDLGDGPNEYSPGGMYCKAGTLLVVRKLGLDTYTYPIAVSHEDVLDESFGVKPDEIYVSLLDSSAFDVTEGT